MKKGKVVNVIQLGQPTLRQKAKPVNNVLGHETQELIENLLITCAKFKGMGIAAPQINVPLRVFIISSNPNPRYPKAPKMKPTPMINPRILEKSREKKKGWEGCLSVPGIRALVPRHTWIKVEYTDRHGNLKKARFTDFVARIFQHELDHLNGIIFLDHAKSTEMMSEKEYLRMMRKEIRKKK